MSSEPLRIDTCLQQLLEAGESQPLTLAPTFSLLIIACEQLEHSAVPPTGVTQHVLEHVRDRLTKYLNRPVR